MVLFTCSCCGNGSLGDRLSVEMLLKAIQRILSGTGGLLYYEIVYSLLIALASRDVLVFACRKVR